MIRARGLESVDVSFFACGIAFPESQKQFDINDIAHVTPTFDTATGMLLLKFNVFDDVQYVVTV